MHFQNQSQEVILIVDDHPHNLQVLFKSLKNAGFKVLIAQNGNIALETAISAQPDLILLDILMSEMDGFETCSRLKENFHTQEIPILFMTALSEAHTKVQGLQLGAVDYITKPFNQEEVIARIKTHLTIKNLNQNLLKQNQQLQQQAREEKLLFQISDRIRQSLDLSSTLATAVAEIQQFLSCDRVLITHIENNLFKIEEQAVAFGIQAISLENYLSEYSKYIQKYYLLQSNQIQSINNLETLDLTFEELQLLKQLQIKSKLVIPIIINSITLSTSSSAVLWGYLIAHQCLNHRQWQASEINFLQRLSTQLAIGIQQGLLYKKLEKVNLELKKIALYDPLTRVFNRRYFDRQISLEWRRHKRMSSPMSVIMCDVDYFKAYNDTFGHQAGDECLVQVVRAISSALKRPGDFVARYGGEEFVVILPHTPLLGAKKVVELIREKVQQLQLPHPNSLVSSIVTLSLGVANTIPNHKDNPALLVEAADQALYLAKQQGRDCFVIYEEQISKSKDNQNQELQWHQLLNQALKENNFCLYAQPITSLKIPNQKQHFEILLRLIDQENRIVSPDVFLEIANRYSLMPKIDSWVVEHLFAKIADSQLKNDLNYCFSVNLSGASLNDEHFLRFLTQKLTQYQISPQLFCFEITESVAISNLERVSNFIQYLQNLGCSFALDDFGKGMSSLTYLKNLPVDYLKIDGSFIRDINQDSVTKAMVEAINNLAQVMGLKTIAEFVENQDILETIQELELDYAQGYHLGKPILLNLD